MEDVFRLAIDLMADEFTGAASAAVSWGRRSYIN
jgi:hypothetical protein